MWNTLVANEAGKEETGSIDVLPDTASISDVLALPSSTLPFCFKLHQILEQVKERGQTHIISWRPHGRAFSVYDPKLFVRDIMPHYFNQTKFASFQRQLNIYGFQRISSGIDKGSYYHSLFLQGQPLLCRSMYRIRIKGNKVRPSKSEIVDPNFYSFPSIEEETRTRRINNGTTMSTMAPSSQVPSIPKVFPNDHSPTVSDLLAAQLHQFQGLVNRPSLQQPQLPHQAAAPSVSTKKLPSHKDDGHNFNRSNYVKPVGTNPLTTTRAPPLSGLAPDPRPLSPSGFAALQQDLQQYHQPGTGPTRTTTVQRRPFLLFVNFATRRPQKLHFLLDGLESE